MTAEEETLSSRKAATPVYHLRRLGDLGRSYEDEKGFWRPSVGSIALEGEAECLGLLRGQRRPEKGAECTRARPAQRKKYIQKPRERPCQPWERG